MELFLGWAKVGPRASQAEVLMVASRILSPALVRQVSASQQLLVVTFGSAQAGVGDNQTTRCQVARKKSLNKSGDAS